MKTLLVTILVTLTTSFAQAGSGSGSVSCNMDDRMLALYTWFHSQADSYAVANIFVQTSEGKFKHYQGQKDEALAPISIVIENKKITVTPDLQNSVCKIEEK